MSALIHMQFNSEVIIEFLLTLIRHQNNALRSNRLNAFCLYFPIQMACV